MAEHRVEHVMGMPVSIDVHAACSPATLDGAFAWLRYVDATFSTYRPDSEISQLNRGALTLGDAHPLVQEVLAGCEAHRVASAGFFNARASGRLDPSGFVKGWAVDRAAAILEHAGQRRFCINAGGDVLVRGGRPGGSPCRVGIQHPRRRDRLACVVELTNGAVATSGAYERGNHVVDPHTRRAPRGVLSVTMIGADLATTDAHATAAFAMGVRGPEWTASVPSLKALTVLESNRVLVTPDFLDHCPGGSVAASLGAPSRASDL